MAPFLLIFTTVLVLISVHIMVLDCARCTGPDCMYNQCPIGCSCLGNLVDCSKRGLTDIPSDLPVWVKILDLQNNDIASIDDISFQGLDNLSELDLNHNKLHLLNSSTFHHLRSLHKLIINHNQLSELPDLRGHPTLNYLSVQHNEIQVLNSSILENLPNLHSLDLSFNELVDLPADTFGNSSSLRHLSLSHNRIINLERGLFDNLTALESLKLNKNRLSAIPKKLFEQLSTLDHLEINSNSLTQIEGLSFQGLVSLSVLKLRSSGIQYLQDGAFYGLNAIKKLQLDYNNISKITKGWLYGLNSLQRLYINNNNISEVEDDAWDSGKRLIELDMTHNSLQTISVKTFDKLFSLKRLILSNNVIQYIEEGAFRSLSALQYLELKNNEVSWTIEDTGKVFSGLHRLKYLGLSNNGIKAVVKRAFTGLSRLEALNLTHNDITTIEENAFDDMTHLDELFINTTSLLCDCKLAWMATFFKYMVNAKCSYPESLKGISIFDISPGKLLCENSPKPVMEKEPRTKITLKGENVTLECQSNSSTSSYTGVHWRKDGRLLHNIRLRINNSMSVRGNVTVFTSSLNIYNIQDEDEGYYQCVISNRYGSVYSSKARITVHVFPVFTKTPVDLAIKTGSTARLECDARGQPHPDIAWQKDGGGEEFPAAKERRMQVMPTDDVFFIVNVKPSDTGVYSCTAQNVAGMIIANATLTVLEIPSFVKKMKDKKSRVGETSVLECMASGSPKPKLTWTKDGAALVMTERHFFAAENQLLVVVDSQVTDAGVYSCEMSNSLGTERGSSQLAILPAARSDGSADESYATDGIIVIVVVACVVGTSIIWVGIIYRTRKRGEDYLQAAANTVPHATERMPYSPYAAVCSKDFKQAGKDMFLDTQSDHSKDSGTGDSNQPGSDDILLEDEHGHLIERPTGSKFSGTPLMGSMLGLHDSISGNSSSNSSVTKEKVPLLRSFRTGACKYHHRKSLDIQNTSAGSYHLSQNGCKNQNSQRWCSAEHVGGNEEGPTRGCSEPPRAVIVRCESECVESDSGFSTFPRSLTADFSSNSSSESPRLHRLPNEVPNDSGSFSIAGEEVQPLADSNDCHTITILPTHIIASSGPSAMFAKT